MSNKEKYIQIDLVEYIPSDSYVVLDPKFRVSLFRELIMKFGGVTRLASLINVNRTSIYDWIKGRVKIPLHKLIKCIKLVSITKSELFKFIIYVTALYNAGAISVKNWKLTINEELSEWFGLLRGDGCISKKYVGCTNASLIVSFFFMGVLEKTFGVSKSNIEITIEIPPNKNLKDVLPIVRLLNTNGYNKVIRRKRKKGKKILLSSRINSKVLSQLLKILVKDLHQLIENSTQKIKVSYVRGFGAAEGSAYQTGSVRVVSFGNKDLNELKFVKNLLHDIGIVHVSDPEQDKKGVYKIKITTQPQLHLFHEKIGFGKHEERNRKLANILKGYKKTLTRVEYEHETVRRSQILEVIRKKGKVTTKEIASEIGVHHTWAGKLLRRMLHEKLIYRTGGWPYIYYFKSSKNTFS